MSVRRPSPPSGAAGKPAGPSRPGRTASSSGARTRPQGSRSPAAPGRASRTRAAEPDDASSGPGGAWPRVLTVRALGLVVVVGLAFTLLFPTVRAYLGQQSQLADMRAQVAASQERIEELEYQKSRWSDDAFVASQARERLAYVYPGETAFRVLDPETVPAVVNPATGKEVEAGPVDTGFAAGPWYRAVWTSVGVAGEVDVPQE
ncbi:MAG: FtsB family cell division protein [Cellulomonadaceae bacterium]